MVVLPYSQSYTVPHPNKIRKPLYFQIYISKKNMKKKGEIRKGSQLSLFSMKYMMTSSHHS